MSAAGRDIGPIPKVADLRRRNRCALDLARFCTTYNPLTFCWNWSDDHRQVIRAIEQSISRRALLAFAMPRGSGKTAICRMAILWAISYAHVQYAYLIGANEAKAVENLDAIKAWMRDLEPYIFDFPEIATAAKHLGGIANRASGQTCCDEPTYIRWEQTRIVLPRVPKPGNLKAEGAWAPTSGSVIGVSGLTGEGIRGALFSTSEGRSIRPGLILLDDPQTDESAASAAQNAARFRLIRGSVLGMAGPGQRISAIMPCTVIRPGDMVDRALDRRENPLWRGVRTRMLASMPSDLAEWEKYFEVYRECMGRDVPEITPANDYYAAHRAVLDAGAAASWPQRKAPDELSAIQHAMNLYCERGREAFFAEYQNEPLHDANDALALTAEHVLRKLNGRPRGEVPRACSLLTAYVDVHDELLYWLAAAWGPDFSEGNVIDYGTYPEQPDRYFTLASAHRTLSGLYPRLGAKGAIYAGLEALLGQLCQRRYRRDDAAELSLDMILVDTGYVGPLVAKVLRALNRGPQLQGAKGFGIRAGSKPFAHYRKEPGTTIGHHWRLAPAPSTGLLTTNIDTNWWKSWYRDAWAAPMGATGSMTLWGTDKEEHRLFADHQVGEFFVRTKGPYGEIDEWKQRPERPDIHWWDSGVGAAVAASRLRLAMPQWEVKRAVTKLRSMKEMREEAKTKHGRR